MLAMSNGLLMSQYDMVVTQWSIVGPALCFPSSLGLSSVSPGLVYIMYLVGKYLGVSNSFKLCSDGLEAATEYSRLILKNIIEPAVKNRDKNELSVEMASHILKAVNIFNPFFDKAAFNIWFLNLLGAKRPTYSLGVLSLSLLKLQLIVLETVFHLPLMGHLVRHFANVFMRVNILIVNNWEVFA